MFYAGAALAAVLAILPPGTAAPSPIAPVSVAVVSATGTGCPSLAPIQPSWYGGRIFFYYPTSYLAGVGPGMRPTDARKQCRLVLKIVPPAGYTFAVTSVTHRGTAVVKAGASGTWQAVHHFEGDPAPEPVRHTFTGPFDDQWQRVEQVPADALVWASCDNPRPLVVSSRLTANAGTSAPTETSWLVMEGVDISPNEYELAWRPC